MPSLPGWRACVSLRLFAGRSQRLRVLPLGRPSFLPQKQWAARRHGGSREQGESMKAYATQAIRNVGIVGHGDTGKTQLVSSLLFSAGMTPRLGKVAEGRTGTDWDEAEIARKISIQTALAYAEC